VDSSLLDQRRLTGLEYTLDGIDRALGADSSELRKHLVHALVHDQIGLDDAAVNSLDAALHLDPTNPLARALKADWLGRQERIDEGLKLLDDPNVGDRDDWFSESTLGSLLWMNGDHDAALTHLISATKGSPQHALPYARLGEAQRLMLDFPASLAAFTEARTFAPQSTYLLERLAEVDRMLDRLPEALKTLKRAEELEGLTSFGLGVRADVLRQRGEFEQAAQAYDQALALDPTDAFSMAWRADVLHSLGRYDEALDGIEAALQQDANLWFSWGIRAIILREFNRYREAGESVATALELEPDPDPWLLYCSGLLHYETGEHDASTSEFRAVLLKEPNDVLTRRLLARSLLETGKVDEGLAVAQAAASIRDADAWTLSTLGDAYATAGKQKDAEKAYTRSRARLEKGPPGPDDGWLEGWLLLQLRRYDEAISALVDEVARKPDETGLDLDLALATLCSGRHQAGIAEYYRAVASAHKREETGRLKGLLQTARFDLQMSIPYHHISNSGAVTQILGLLENWKEGGRSIEALWVDDNPTNNTTEMEIIGQLLGVQFDTATDTDEAIAKLKSDPDRFSFVITDMARGIDRRAGLTLLRKMHDSGLDRPTIIYAASSNAEREAEAQRHGAFAMTNSPSRLHELVSMIVRNLTTTSATATESPGRVEVPEMAR
jgi:tetratricopeptide (TPR) repeat protein